MVVQRGLGNTIRERYVPASWPGTYIPNLSDWCEGDILLVQGSGLVGALISAGQRVSQKPRMVIGSYWSHAAIYLGNGIVVDATFRNGVQSQPLWNYCKTRTVTLRRLVDPTMPQLGARIAATSATHIGKSYSGLQILLGKLGWPAGQAPNGNHLYCSTFVGLTVAQATGVLLWSNPAFQPLYPAMLATHPDLTRVQLAWRNI